MFENRVLRRISGPDREEVVGGWRRLHNEELHNLYASLCIIRVIKSRTGRVARMGEIKKVHVILKTWKEDSLGDLGVDGRIILE
jgi:hypothetical protein